MTSTDITSTPPQGAPLSAMRLPELKSLAQQMGLKGLSGKRKGDLIAMIEGARGGRPAPATAPDGDTATATATATRRRSAQRPQAAPEAAATDAGPATRDEGSTATSSAPSADQPAAPARAASTDQSTATGPDRGERDERPRRESGGRSGGSRQGRGQQGRDQADGDQQSGDKAGRDGREDQNGNGGRGDQAGQRGRGDQNGQGGRRDQNEREGQGRQGDQRGRNGQDGRNDRGGQDNRNDRGNQGGRDEQGRQGSQRGRDDQGRQGNQRGRDEQDGQDGGDTNGPRGDGQNRDDDGGGRGRRSRRRRERNRGGGRPVDGEAEVREDDVLQPVAGILDVLDNYAFVRTSGYLAGNNDVYVSMNMIRRHGLRRGDAITGAVKMPRDGQSDAQFDGPGGGQGGGRGGGQGGKNRAKFNPLARIDTVNGGPVEQARQRPDFSKLTPLYPNQRLRLETEKNIISTRVIDLIMPIGKGQRALIVSPPKAGKTTILQNIANAIAINNPECHLMVVLVDERPEEVTDMQRSVKGEVIASTFDRPPSDHTQVAELAIERAKRLVELGQDVVVLLDSITRLGRAYNNSSPASGRILSGGVDSTALYPPKRFLGAARNIENGGSLTIIATAMVETGSAGDTVIFEEFKGTGNAELKLDRRIAERRVFPAVDVGPSGTRKEELLMSPEEAGIMHKLRRVLSGLDTHQAIDLLMSQLRKTNTNYEFLLQVAKTTPTLPQDEE
ncbi:transcription termination factor Rho [Dietzia sp. CH92]|uniref:transcription termination factor Rho n=1 Tax=Dietzia sp. CH92 TaxID=3051823 RepID=UPI0028D801BA|nr:transcription termination factor Rho [Dietzia sp. CH92]